MIALGRGQSSDAGKEEAMCKCVLASWPTPVGMVEGLELGKPLHPSVFWLSAKPIRNVSAS